MWTTVLIITMVLAGASLQRVTGMGFALVVAPFLVLLLGPIDGVVLVNACAVLTGTVILVRVRRQVQWRRYLVLAGAALIGIVPGAFLLRVVSVAWLEIAIGVLIIVGITASVFLGRMNLRDRSSFRVGAGIVAGFMNATAGVGGPAVSMYAVATRWPHASFVATMQPFFLTIGLASLAAKFATGAATAPSLPVIVWVLIGAACLGGLALGEVLARVLQPHIARRLLVIVAYVGSAATIYRGITELLA
ncbi:MAG: sulfite exporter TauE/SafE family protein [Cryobacterium sp.]